ncbi:Arg-Lys translocation region protein phosphatase RktP [Leptospira brenneri]|uniref:Arg-Lys translocation region protein phosphatase n=1 Tax=Leptospira brenneri TaxID=2023182 RepID=A0A2M9XZM1_9LEPT|nr:Arg-Lys translocation region protein phosphatase RktP [Leptospira brenneri]PJZ44757.1 Arg-Lys translocation region protein phosphatase [Leptospira brenneri]TGK97000.1 Arg-Lys translocation region protein phosphatase [Leptospira brenneri]
MSYRVKLPILFGIISFLFFLIHFLFAEFTFTHWQNPKGENTLNFNLVGVYSSFVFSLLTGFIIYYFLGFLYQFILHVIAHIQDNELPKDIRNLNQDSEEYKIYKSVRFALLQGDESLGEEQFENKFDWKTNQAVSVNKQIPDIQIPKIPGFDVSVFPSVMRYAGADYIRIVRAKDGIFGILAGHMEPGILESSEKVFIHGIVSSFGDGLFSTEELLEKLKFALHQFTFLRLKISAFVIQNKEDKMSFLHYMDMPIFQFSDHGIQVIEGSGDDHWYPNHKHPLSMADGIEIGDYLVWASDRTLTQFGLTSFEIMEEFVDYLLDLRPSSSRQMLLAIAKKMSALGAERNLTNPMEKLSILVVRRNK